ncbi:MAG: ankyrin repeat domain-containing protein [Alphaproteobacteria bacterium]|nr:ankyrin repeat domain-containing protein [Alphaproteobacteria bacterium]
MKFFVILVSLLCIQSASAAEYNAFTPLVEAVTTENTSAYAIETLIKKGGRVNERDEQGRTVLMLASIYLSDPIAFVFLIEGGAEVNARTPDTGQTALFFAAQYNQNPEVVRTLLSSGADRTAKDVFGRTAYDYAERNPKLKDSPTRLLLQEH